MPDSLTGRPAICLNMIVRNEAHIIHEVLETVVPHISSWVIVDTGSDDGTQDVIRNYMASRGIRGELHERPWRNFGHNRSEALALAQGHGDYIWMIDADDVLVGTPDFSRLSADAYRLHYRQTQPFFRYWRLQLFRDGLPWRYDGVVHECAACDERFVEERLDGEYYIDSRRLGSRSRDPQKYALDRDLLLADVERNPGNTRSTFYLARSYFDLRDYANARKWFARRAEMGGWAEEVYFSMFKVADCMWELREPWPTVQDAYLRAWEFRPIRAEPLHSIARLYRIDKRYQLGYLFAERAAAIAFPEDEELFVLSDVYAWRAADEKAVCAFWIGEHGEAVALCRRLLARRDVPEDDRTRIATNRDYSVPALIEAASSYPDVLAQGLVAGPRNAEVTVSLVAGPDRGAVERMLNSFLQCCVDVQRVGRFLLVDAGLSAQDRAALHERYGFLEFGRSVSGDALGIQLAQIRWEIEGRFWLHLGEGWRFFTPEGFVSRLTAVLEAEPEVFQVGINFGDAVRLTGACATEDIVRRAADAGRYVLTDLVARGPAMFDTARLDRAGNLNGDDADPIAELVRRATAAGLRTASLDEVLCIAETR
jgi:glycosyltransferase involved in cell wall biosynthesis